MYNRNKPCKSTYIKLALKITHEYALVSYVLQSTPCAMLEGDPGHRRVTSLLNVATCTRRCNIKRREKTKACGPMVSILYWLLGPVRSILNVGALQSSTTAEIVLLIIVHRLIGEKGAMY